jgi:hypothetical protein
VPPPCLGASVVQKSFKKAEGQKALSGNSSLPKATVRIKVYWNARFFNNDLFSKKTLSVSSFLSKRNKKPPCLLRVLVPPWFKNLLKRPKAKKTFSNSANNYVLVNPKPGLSFIFIYPFSKLNPPVTRSSAKSKLPSKSIYFVFEQL